MEEEAAKLKEMQKEAEDSLMSPSHGGIYSFFCFHYSTLKLLQCNSLQHGVSFLQKFIGR